MDFLNFLIEAKKNTYASFKMVEKINKDDSRELLYEVGKYKYVDRYYGFNPFIGQEIVFKDESFFWGLNYYGYIENHLVSEKEIYSFLKKALLKVESRFPFRGPNIYKEGDYEYFSDTSGDLEKFIGKERIEFKGKTIYVGFYHGGLVRPKIV